MMTTERAKPEDQPEPVGPFYTTWGPLDGPIRYADASHAIGVHDSPEAAGFPIGIAFPVGWIRARRGRPVATFRLTVRDVQLDGEWVCRGRRFERIGDAAEEV